MCGWQIKLFYLIKHGANLRKTHNAGTGTWADTPCRYWYLGMIHHDGTGTWERHTVMVIGTMERYTIQLLVSEKDTP